MRYGRFFGKKSIQYVFLLGCCISILVVICLLNVSAQMRMQGELQQLSIKSKDKELEINWEPSHFSEIESVQISICGDDYSEVVDITPSMGKYSFVKGTHGVLYSVSIMTVSNTGRTGKEYVYDRLFLDYSQLPDLPLIVIETENNVDPTYVNAVKTGSNLWGETITDNEYVRGVVSFEGKDIPNISCDARIRVRGNTTAVNQDKKSYKIVLDNEYDLLGRGDEYEDTEWLLLNAGTNLKTYIGSYLGTYLGSEWQPQMQYVNVIMNGDWKGCYLLSESVKQSSSRCSISEDGYLFENDAYWWNSNEYFKTSFQPSQFGFTVKYPDIKDKNDVRLSQLRKYMQIIEDKIMAADEDLFEYIDAESFAAWILVRDIMGQDDGGGSNIYYYIDEINWDNLSENKLKMGPLWDFDVSFVRTDDWSVQHNMEGLYFDYLLENPEFRKIYVEKWEEIKDTLEDDLSKYLEALYTDMGEELQKSRKLDSARWTIDIPGINGEIEDCMDWVKRRIQWMNTAMGVE